MMIKSGDFTIDECNIAWEAIVKVNNKVSGNRDYDNYFTKLKAYGVMLYEYNMVKGYLCQLLFEVDNEAIAYLKTAGYPIRTQEGYDAYEHDVLKAFNKSNNLATRIKMKGNELNNIGSQTGQQHKVSSFDMHMANLISELGFHVPDDITLARYNEFRVILKQRKAEADKQARKRNKFKR